MCHLSALKVGLIAVERPVPGNGISPRCQNIHFFPQAARRASYPHPSRHLSRNPSVSVRPLPPFLSFPLSVSLLDEVFSVCRRWLSYIYLFLFFSFSLPLYFSVSDRKTSHPTVAGQHGECEQHVVNIDGRTTEPGPCQHRR